jgi:sulfatase maturation enzyme AslB (radical SAM superfamily)
VRIARLTQPTTTGVTLRDLATAALPLGRNLAAMHLPMLRAKSPAFASWAVTEGCNLKCAHCSMNRPLPDELTHEQRLDVARKLAASDAWGVSLIGGEPLLVKGLFEYAKILKSAGKRVFLGTSGERLDRHIDDLFDAGIDYLTVSFEGHTAAEHDAFRGRAGLFDRVAAALAQITARRTGSTPRSRSTATISGRSTTRSTTGWSAPTTSSSRSCRTTASTRCATRAASSSPKIALNSSGFTPTSARATRS